MSQWQQLNERYDALQLREKRLIFFGSLLLVAWLCLVVLLEPAVKKWQANAVQAQTLTQTTQQLSEQVNLLQLQLTQDINQPIKADIAAKQQQQQDMLTALGAYQQQFITGSQTVKMLQDLLSPLSQLQLVSLRAEQPTPIRLPGEATDAQAQLYQHVTVLTVSGNYQQLLALLEQVERLPWLLSWQKLEYQVIDYPKAQMTLFISTVSADESYIQF